MTDSIEIPEKSEIELLREKADFMGLKYHPTIGLDKLKEKVNAVLSDDAPEEATEVAIAVETKAQRNARLRKNATKLVRVNLTCMNPNKKQWPGEVFTAGNRFIGTVKKFIPFNAEEGFHIPAILLNIIQERQYMTFQSSKVNGKSIKRPKLVKEFALEYLDPLTEQELRDLANKQALANNGA